MRTSTKRCSPSMERTPLLYRSVQTWTDSLQRSGGPSNASSREGSSERGESFEIPSGRRAREPIGVPAAVCIMPAERPPPMCRVLFWRSWEARGSTRAVSDLFRRDFAVSWERWLASASTAHRGTFSVRSGGRAKERVARSTGGLKRQSTRCGMTFLEVRVRSFAGK